MEIARNEKVKQSKNGQFPSNYKASPIDFETQISLQKQAPQKGPLKNISPGAYIFQILRNITILRWNFTVIISHFFLPSCFNVGSFLWERGVR